MLPSPPKYALRFLRWFCEAESIEEIEGDLVELFEYRYEESPSKAKRQFVWRVLLSFRPEFIKTPKILKNSNLRSMLQHNVLISYRNFLRYKSSFLINLFGLSVGLACVLLIWLWVSDELSMDKFHENDARLVEVMENVDQATGMITRYSTPGLLAGALPEDMPEVKTAITTTFGWDQKFMLSVGNNDIKARGVYVGEQFFEMFSYPLIDGDRQTILSDKNSVVLTERIAMNLFGTTENLIGKTVELEQEESFMISGIMENLSGHSSIEFDFILHFEKFRDENDWLNDWTNTGPKTFALLEEGADINALNQKLENYIVQKTEGAAAHRKPFVTSFSDLYLNNRYENGKVAGGRIEYVRLFSVIAIFILLIACINFMNLSTARASRRLKEVGVKKAMGAARNSLVFQFLSESILIVIASMLVAIGLVYLFLPQFNFITGKELMLVFDLRLISILSLITVITGIIAGSYPALYLSGFNPVMVLKGKLNKQTGEQWARRGLVVFQFSLSIILIVAVWVVYSQIEYVQNENLGYQSENILLVEKTGALTDNARSEVFLSEAEKLLPVTDASAFGHAFSGKNGGTYGVTWPGKDPEDRTEFERVPVEYGALELLEIKMNAGRPFSKDLQSDSMKIVFNQAAIDFMGIEDPIGKKVDLWGDDREIIGVTEDFHFESFRTKVEPLFFFIFPFRSNNMLLKIKPGQEREAVAQLEQLHQKLNPGFQFDFKFMDESFGILYASEQRVSKLSQYFAALAIAISALGLFGLVAFTAERRVKEIGIRKILGSGQMDIILLLGKDFSRMVLVSIVIALPISYFIASDWLDGFAYRIDLNWWLFAGSGLLALLIAWVTVALQTIKISRVNPVDCIKNE
ncbi:MAG: ABC transporter permease [Bacteroidota bacterium]